MLSLLGKNHMILTEENQKAVNRLAIACLCCWLHREIPQGANFLSLLCPFRLRGSFKEPLRHT